MTTVQQVANVVKNESGAPPNEGSAPHCPMRVPILHYSPMIEVITIPTKRMRINAPHPAMKSSPAEYLDPRWPFNGVEALRFSDGRFLGFRFPMSEV